MARKREERAARNAHRAARKARAAQGATEDQSFVSLKQQLAAICLTLREIPGDGNCLFGALGDQLDGTPNNHHKHRQDVVHYMRQHRDDFEPFVEDDVPFERHLSNLAELGTYAGNDCIVAFARLQGVMVVIHQLNAPLWRISGVEGQKNLRELHISYHNGDHYNSVRRIGDTSHSPANIKLAVLDSGNGAKDGKKNKSKLKDEEDDDESAQEYSWCGDGYDFSEPVYEGLSKAEQQVMDQTGCEDLRYIRQQLEQHDYAVHETIDSILNYIVHDHKGDYPQTTSPTMPCKNGLWGPTGTGTRLFGEDAFNMPAVHPSYQKKSAQEKIQAKLKNQQHLSNAKRKDLKKQMRKQQASERKRQQHLGAYDENDAKDQEEEVIINCLAPLTKEDSLNNVNVDELRTMAEINTHHFLDVARQMEAFFLQKRFLLSMQKPELILKEDISEMGTEIRRKDELIMKHSEKIQEWKTLLTSLQAKPSMVGPRPQGAPNSVVPHMAPASTGTQGGSHVAMPNLSPMGGGGAVGAIGGGAMGGPSGPSHPQLGGMGGGGMGMGQPSMMGQMGGSGMGPNMAPGMGGMTQPGYPPGGHGMVGPGGGGHAGRGSPYHAGPMGGQQQQAPSQQQVIGGLQGPLAFLEKTTTNIGMPDPRR
ncbi:mediator complex subunit 28 [Oratosquilla oratoria]|uniref:mediator complex subunit 28 n=1 Tax=Oratosquilla oratoria TaxID=337810 RepID=UPI003F763452